LRLKPALELFPNVARQLIRNVVGLAGAPIQIYMEWLQA